MQKIANINYIKNKMKKILSGTCAALAVLCAAALLIYYMFVFSGIQSFTKWRDIWIETAMTTMNHQWLATSFIPSEIIEMVMDAKRPVSNIIGGLNQNNSLQESDTLSDFFETDKTTDKTNTFMNTDVLDQANITVREPDYAGYTVLVNDIEQGIVISEITGSGYKGRIMLIDDPSRVYVATTRYKNIEGMRILSMMNYYGAVAGINASGFPDPEGEGNGGKIVGQTFSENSYWGNYVNWTGSILLTHDNRLIVGNVRSWDDHNVRGGIQFGPVLIADGEIQVKGSAGWGIQPRTAIGQRADGVIALLVIDGRDITHSVGCTVGELALILSKYNIKNAACCDGGASSALAYNGEIITRNSSANPIYGRRLPNAFLVAPKQ